MGRLQVLQYFSKRISIFHFQHCSSKAKSKSPHRHRRPLSKAGRKNKSLEPSKELSGGGSTIGSNFGSNTIGSGINGLNIQNSQFLIDSSLRGPAKIRDDDVTTFNAAACHQVTAVGLSDLASARSVSNVISSVNSLVAASSSSSLSNNSLLLSNSVYSQAESPFNNAIHSTNNVSSFSKPFPPSKGSSSVRSFKSNSVEMNRTKVSDQKMLTSSSTRKFFKSEKKFDSSRVRIFLKLILWSDIFKGQTILFKQLAKQ